MAATKALCSEVTFFRIQDFFTGRRIWRGERQNILELLDLWRSFERADYYPGSLFADSLMHMMVAAEPVWLVSPGLVLVGCWGQSKNQALLCFCLSIDAEWSLSVHQFISREQSSCYAVKQILQQCSIQVVWMRVETGPLGEVGLVPLIPQVVCYILLQSDFLKFSSPPHWEINGIAAVNTLNIAL